MSVEMLNSISPAVYLALVALIVQSIFAIIENVHNWKTRDTVRKATKIDYVVAMLNLIDGIPITEADKCILKMQIAREYLPDGIPTQITERLTGEI